MYEHAFGFVSGHDFSRAAKEQMRIGLEPLPALIGQRKKPGAKAQFWTGLNGPTKVVP
jgi:hypothetical protein